jgi:hypothetical protein
LKSIAINAVIAAPSNIEETILCRWLPLSGFGVSTQRNRLGNAFWELAKDLAISAPNNAYLNKASHRQQLVELRSQADAIVQPVAKVAVRSVLQSGQQFFALVPIADGLEVEANISGNESGFVHVKDPVSVKFDTFPYS